METSSKMDGGVVHVCLKGDLVAENAQKEIEKWLDKGDVKGFISDIRELTSQPATEQKKLEEWRKTNGTGKPNALLGRDNAMSAIVKIYIRFTKAENTRYFTNFDEAKAWVLSYK